MRVLVVFHVYYESLAGYYLEKMRNIHSCEWDLIITGSELSDSVKAQVRELKPDAEFMECPNIGYDVWPFIMAIKSVDLGKYDIVLKLHTKNGDARLFNFHGKKVDGAGWKEMLVNPLVGDAKAFSKVLKAFSSNPKLGILYSLRANYRSKGGCPEDSSMLSDEIKRLGIDKKSSNFCSGTMFAVRADTLEFLKRDDINENIFEHSGPSHGNATMAHVYERLIPIVVLSSGAKLKLVSENFLSSVMFSLRYAVDPFIQWIFSIDYYGSDRTKYLKLFGHNFVLHKEKSQSV